MTASHEADMCRTVRWVGDAATGSLAFDRSDPAADGIRRDRLPGRARRSGKRSRHCGCEAHRPSASRRRMARSSGLGSRGTDDPATHHAVARRSHRVPAHQPPDRRQPVLGARPDGRRVAPPDQRMTARAILDRLLSEARTIDEEDRAMCRAIGRTAQAWSNRGRGS